MWPPETLLGSIACTVRAMTHNKRLERTVTRYRVRATSVPFHGACQQLSSARRVFVVLGLVAVFAPLSFSGRDFYDDGVLLFKVVLSLGAAPAGLLVLAPSSLP